MGWHACELASFDSSGRDRWVMKKAKLIVMPGVVSQEVILIGEADAQC